MVGGDRQVLRDAAVVPGLILERQAAALRVVETGDALVEHAPELHVVVERVDGAELVVDGVHVGLAGEGLRQRRRIIEADKLRNKRALAPARRRLDAIRPRIAAAGRYLP